MTADVVAADSNGEDLPGDTRRVIVDAEKTPLARAALADDDSTPVMDCAAAPIAGASASVDGSMDRDTTVSGQAERDDLADDRTDDTAETEEMVTDRLFDAQVVDWGSEHDDVSIDALGSMTIADPIDPETDETDWFSAGVSNSDLTDFDSHDHEPVVVWDDSSGSLPDVRIVRDDRDPAMSRVILGDVVLAEFGTGWVALEERLRLVPLSAARRLGWVFG